MSLPGKTMQIGGYNYHVSDQGEGDKVAFLVHFSDTWRKSALRNALRNTPDLARYDQKEPTLRDTIKERRH